MATSSTRPLPPSPLFFFSFLLPPAGNVKRVGGDKRTGLTVEEVARVLERDLAQGQYFVTGDLTREVFADDCRFKVRVARAF
jgi:hypothetical protein